MSRRPNTARKTPPKLLGSSPCASDDAIAEAFAVEQEGYLAFRGDLGAWMVWTGSEWQRDDRAIALNAIRRLCRSLSTNVTDENKRMRLLSMRKISDVERLARSDPRFAHPAGKWDSDEWILNTPAGLVDLRTGHLDRHDSSFLITRITSASPGGECPTWLSFIRTVTSGDGPYQTFLQRLAGYCLTGSVREQVFFFLLGSGANGKTVFTQTLSAVLGPYATTASMETFMASSSPRHPADIAALEGRRLVLASETDTGRFFSESRIKALTGGDEISARFMNRNFTTFIPRCKIVLVGNATPRLHQSDEAMRRRLHLLPFTVAIPLAERDPDLPAKLAAEHGGILAWAIQGCLDWQAKGLAAPPVVVRATQNYFDRLDPIGRFLTECCILGPEHTVGSTELHGAYVGWAGRLDIPAQTQNAFVREIGRKGLRTIRTARLRLIEGIRLNESRDPRTRGERS